jgi:PIN domain nuclease of toxin-antitoxin system
MWEIAIKRSLGKLTVPEDLPAQITTGGCGWLPVTQEHAWEVRPLDRLLIAQSLSERIPVITRDTRFAGYGIDVRWT